MQPEIFGMVAFHLVDALLEELRLTDPALRSRAIERARSGIAGQPSDAGWNNHQAPMLTILNDLAAQ